MTFLSILVETRQWNAWLNFVLTPVELRIKTFEANSLAVSVKLLAVRNSVIDSAQRTSVRLVCYTAVSSVVTQRFSPVLRDDTKNGCVAD